MHALCKLWFICHTLFVAYVNKINIRIKQNMLSSFCKLEKSANKFSAQTKLYTWYHNHRSMDQQKDENPRTRENQVNKFYFPLIIWSIQYAYYFCEVHLKKTSSMQKVIGILETVIVGKYCIINCFLQTKIVQEKTKKAEG